MPRSQRDQMEAMLRQADASLEKWFRGAKTRGAGILRQRVDDLQAGLKKLRTGLEQVERERSGAPAETPRAHAESYVRQAAATFDGCPQALHCAKAKESRLNVRRGGARSHTGSRRFVT